MKKGIKTYNNLTKIELLEKLTEEFSIHIDTEEDEHVKYNPATGTLHIIETETNTKDN